MDKHYEELCEVVKTRAILSLGITTFKLLEEEHIESSKVRSVADQGSEVRLPEVTSTEVSWCEVLDVEVQVFNVWLLCGRAYVIDPSSAQFLVAHGFDFNKQFSQGLTYTPPESRDKVC